MAAAAAPPAPMRSARRVIRSLRAKVEHLSCIDCSRASGNTGRGPTGVALATGTLARRDPKPPRSDSGEGPEARPALHVVSPPVVRSPRATRVPGSSRSSSVSPGSSPRCRPRSPGSAAGPTPSPTSFPLSVLSGATSTAFLAGFGLLVIAGALARRQRRAWWIALVLLVIAGISHLIKDLDIPKPG